MIEKYYILHNDTLSFKVVEFVRDHKLHASSLSNMRDELKSLNGIKSIETDKTRVQSGIGDPTLQLVLVRERLNNKIAEYEAMVDIYDRTMECLSDRDRLILETMCAPDALYACEELEEILHVERTCVYNYRREAIHKFESYVVGFLQA